MSSLQVVPSAAFARLCCPTCKNPKGFLAAAGKEFGCTECKNKPCCPCCGKYYFVFVHAADPRPDFANDTCSRFLCTDCGASFEWNDKGEMNIPALTGNESLYKALKCICGGKWRFHAAADSPHWSCDDCGGVMLPNDLMAKRTMSSWEAANKPSLKKTKSKQAKKRSKKATKPSDELVNKIVNFNEYQKFKAWQKNAAQHEEFKRFLGVRDNINACMTELVSYFREIRVGLADMDEDIADTLDTHIQDLDDIFSQVFIGHSDDLWQEKDSNSRESWADRGDEYDPDATDLVPAADIDDDDDDDGYIISASHSREMYQHYSHYAGSPRKLQYSDVIIEDDLTDLSEGKVISVSYSSQSSSINDPLSLKWGDSARYVGKRYSNIWGVIGEVWSKKSNTCDMKFGELIYHDVPLSDLVKTNSYIKTPCSNVTSKPSDSKTPPKVQPTVTATITTEETVIEESELMPGELVQYVGRALEVCRGKTGEVLSKNNEKDYDVLFGNTIFAIHRSLLRSIGVIND